MTRNLRTYCVLSCHSFLLVLLLAIGGLSAGCSASSTVGTVNPPKPTPMPLRKIIGTFREFPLGPDSYPGDISTGSDGNLWFTYSGSLGCCAKIERITPKGKISEFPLSSPSLLLSITSGPDGNLWFTGVDASSGIIGRITPTGTISKFPFTIAPFSITTGPDGNLWFTAIDPSGKTHSEIARITPTGTISKFGLPIDCGQHLSIQYQDCTPSGIIAGPDGNLWFTELYGNRIGRITPSGTITEFPVPGANSNPMDITKGPDGALWFTEEGNKIGRITPTGTISEFGLPTSGNHPQYITTGPDGALWFTVVDSSKLWRITTMGVISTFSLPESDEFPQHITTGPDGALWLTASGGCTKCGKIWRLA